MASQRARSAGRPTLDQVAARAGVGRGTVSRVVNGSAQVSAHARAAVQQAIAELGYVPNLAARALVTQRTDAVALVVAESPERVLHEEYLAGLMRGVNQELLGSPLNLWLAIVSSSVERGDIERRITPQHVDGALLVCVRGDDPLPAVLARRGLPVVASGLLPGRARVERMSCVDADHMGAARVAVRHLLERGRARVASIGGPRDGAAGAALRAGYREALRDARHTVDEALIAYGGLTDAGGMSAMATLLDRRPDLDAVFAATDSMALGAMRTLRARGRRIPDDVAVIGYGDSTLARHCEPPLTTMHEPVLAMGSEMARLLTAHIAGVTAVPSSVLLDTHLVVRASA